MKKLLLSALVLGIALFMSCSKKSDSAASSSDNGGGSTLKRVHELYQKEGILRLEWNEDSQTWDTTQNEEYDLGLTGVFNWDNDKLTSITRKNNDPICALIYNSNGLVSSVIDKDNDTSFLTYNNNNQIIRCDKHSGDGSVSGWEITYSNDKPSKIEFLQPNEISHITYTWDGDNMITEHSYGSYGESIHTYTYDNYYHPFYGHKCIEALSLTTGPDVASKNNLLTNQIEDRITTYSYVYSGNYPTEIKEVKPSTENENLRIYYIYYSRYTYLD